MIKVGQNIILEISKDRLYAYVTLKKELEEDYIQQDLTKSLDKIKEHITYGLNEELLISILEKNIIDKKLLIAKGKPAIDGKDGGIKYNFSIKKSLLPKLKEDGTVDYRELDSINTVSKNDILAEIIPPKDGELGIRVDGEKIEYKKGRTPIFKFGKNVYPSFDGNTLISSSNGLVQLKNGKVSVSEVLQLDNVDNSVGNINFDGDVIVAKDVLNGFILKSTGSVEVKGAVEGGFIDCKEDVLVRQGIQGYNRDTINTKGNLGTKFIENSIVKVGGNITAEAIMHSNVVSDSNILVLGKKGLIVGGNCRATHEVRARIIGSTMATTTVVEVGINPEIKDEHDELEDSLNVTNINLKKIEQSLKVLEALEKSDKLDDAKEALYKDLLKAQANLNLELNNTREKLDLLKIQLNQQVNGKIKVADTIYPGVKIIIGNSFMFIRDEMKKCTFYRENGEIRVGPY